MFWLLVGLVLAAGYTYRHDLRARRRPHHGGVHAGPGRRRAGKTVEIARTQRGEFQVIAEINGARISTVLDTGASAVVLTQEAAKAAGLPLEVLSYTVNVETANGRTRAAPVTLDRRGDRHHRRARGAGADRAARAAANQPARHELPQPPAKAGRCAATS